MNFMLGESVKCCTAEPPSARSGRSPNARHQFALRGLENTYIEKQKADGGLIHRHLFMVRNMVQTRTILALYSTAGANLVKKFNDFRWTNSLTSRGNTKRNDNLFAPKN